MKRAIIVAAAMVIGSGVSSMAEEGDDSLDRAHQQMLERHNPDISTTLVDCLVGYFDPLNGAQREIMTDFFTAPDFTPATPPNAAVREVLATLPPQRAHMEVCLEAELAESQPAGFSAETSAHIPIWSAMLSGDPEGYAPAFTYLAPKQAFRNIPEDVLRLIGAGGLPLPLDRMIFVDDLDADVARLTGLDLSNVHAFMTIGDVREKTTALAIPGTDASLFAEAFGARDFSRREIAGQSVYHMGEDNQINLGQRDPSDPFGRLMGLSQRVALVGDTVLVSNGWAVFEQAVETLAVQQDCGDCQTWQAMIDAVGDVYLEYASGWPAVSSFRMEDLASINVDAGTLPPFDLAMFAVTVEQDRHTPKLIVHFSEAASAAAGTTEIERRLESGIAPGPNSEPSQPMAVRAAALHESDATGGTVAVLAIETDGSMEAAYRVIAEWKRTIMMGPQFRPLAWN